MLDIITRIFSCSLNKINNYVGSFRCSSSSSRIRNNGCDIFCSDNEMISDFLNSFSHTVSGCRWEWSWPYFESPDENLAVGRGCEECNRPSFWGNPCSNLFSQRAPKETKGPSSSQVRVKLKIFPISTGVLTINKRENVEARTYVQVHATTSPSLLLFCLCDMNYYVICWLLCWYYICFSICSDC